MVCVWRTIVTPGVSASTRNMLSPPRLPLARSVAATSWKKSASAGVGDPALVAVDHVVIALAHRGGAHRAGIGARVGLRLREGRHLLAAQHREKVLFLLRVGQREQDRPQVRPEHERPARRHRDRARHLLPDHHHAEQVQALSAVLDRHVEEPQPELLGLRSTCARTSGLMIGPSIDVISIGISSRSTKSATVFFSILSSSGRSKSIAPCFQYRGSQAADAASDQTTASALSPAIASGP